MFEKKFHYFDLMKIEILHFTIQSKSNHKRRSEVSSFPYSFLEMKNQKDR